MASLLREDDEKYQSDQDGTAINVSQSNLIKYEEIARKTKEKADRLFEEIDRFEKVSKGSTTYKIDNTSINIPLFISCQKNLSPKCWFAETLIPGDAESVSRDWVDSSKNLWSNTLSKIVKLKVNGRNDLFILNVESKPIGKIVSARDYVHLNWKTIEEQDGTIQINTKCIDYDDIPPQNGVVRGEIVFGAIRFKNVTVDEAQRKYDIETTKNIKMWTNVKYMIQTDLKGWMFQSIADSAMPKTLTIQMNIVQKYWINKLA